MAEQYQGNTRTPQYFLIIKYPDTDDGHKKRIEFMKKLGNFMRQAQKDGYFLNFDFDFDRNLEDDEW